MNYIYQIIDGDVLARIKDGETDGKSDAEMLVDGKWIPAFPLDVVFEGRPLTNEELTRFGVPATDDSGL